MGTRYDHLTLSERKLIFQLREAKMSVPRIAERLCRRRSTIHREIRRNWHDDGPWLRGYFPQAAQSRTDRRRIRQRKLHLNPDLARHVIAQLQQAWSPEQIAGRLRRESGGEQRISHETIYQFVYGDVGRQQNLYQLLPCQRRRRRKRYARKPRGVTIPPENTFSERPDEIAERSSFGHWEGDLVMFRRAHGQRSVLSLVERQTRFAVLRVQPSRHSKPIMNSLTEDLGGLPPAARRTVTFDRGTEFAAYPALKTSLGMDAYFCAPQAPWQKGTVENTNGRLRRFLPLDADISDRSTADLRALAAKMNATPRKCLGFMTPAEAFAASLRSCGVSSAGPGP
ncbi:IS30 family transposase [Phenylobacterium sp.]|uniref:IS30 family transposase n=1 Tax=Phenylobacterium sp. TaxID=1871053 RepID=UPI00260A264B|nr:IS30 family transposase [Phenylobacterium sp.]